MHPAHRIVMALPLSLLLLAGCGKSGSMMAPQTAASSDPSTATEEVARHPELVDDGMYASDTQAPAGFATGPGGTFAAIRPLFFWRHITRIERSFEFAFSDTDSAGAPTSAVIIVHKRLSGTFNVVARDSGGDGSPTQGHVIEKPLHDHWVRRLLLKRVAGSGDHRPWRIAATSGVQVTSRDARTRIQSLRVQSAGLDTTITDPLAFFRLRRLLRLEVGVDVALTATTLAADDVVLFYVGDRRLRFQNQGHGSYSLTWRSFATDGVRHFGVNALSHGSLFDDQAPYDSQAWLLPYVAGAPELADLAP